jgi:tetratricopeptide (TPR) repeat protein
MELPSWDRSRTKKRPSPGGGGGGDDAFQGAVREVGRGAARRGLWIVLGLVAVLGAAVAIVVVNAQQETKGAERTAALASVASYEARARITDPQVFGGAKQPFPVFADEAAREAAITGAIADLQKVAPGSSPEVLTRLVEGAAQLRGGRFADAAASYRRFLSAVDERHPLYFMGREGLAFALEGAGELDAAVAELKGLAGLKGSLYREMALYHQARVLAGAGRKEEALAAVKIYMEEFPLQEPSLARDQVRGLLEGLDPSLLAGTERAPTLQLLDPPAE